MNGLSGGPGIIAGEDGPRTGTAGSARQRDALPATRPGAAGEAGSAPPHPPPRSANLPRGAQSRPLRPPRAPPDERGSIAPSASRRTALPGGLVPPPGPRQAKFLSRPRRRLLTRRVPPPAPGGRGHERRASGESGPPTGAEPGPVNPGGKQKPVRASGRDRPRLRERERGGTGSGSRGRPAPRLREGAPAPRPGGRRGAPQRGWGLRRAGREAPPAPLARTRRPPLGQPREA